MKETVTFISAFALLAVFILITPSTPMLISKAFEKHHKIISDGEHSAPLQFPEFLDRTLDANITFSHHQGGATLTGLDEVMGGGGCALDYDADGWMDLFLVNGSGQTRYFGKQQWWQNRKGHALYKNLGNGQFMEVTKRSGLTR